MTTPLAEPRIEIGRRLLIAGISEWDCDHIPFQWQRFTPYINTIPSQVGTTTYGVHANSDDDGLFEYIAGIEVSAFEGVPSELKRLRIPAQTYAVFTHRDHISAIRNTWNDIFSTWLPQSGRTMADGPEFERYGDDFDPRTGNGNVEIWIPLVV